MWKAVIPKSCSFWIKTPFLFHQTSASGILLRKGGRQQDPTCCSVIPHTPFPSGNHHTVVWSLFVSDLTQNSLSVNCPILGAFIKTNQLQWFTIAVAVVAITVGASKKLNQKPKRKIWIMRCPKRALKAATCFWKSGRSHIYAALCTCPGDTEMALLPHLSLHWRPRQSCKLPVRELMACPGTHTASAKGGIVLGWKNKGISVLLFADH